MPPTIRPITPEDYVAVCDVINAAYPYDTMRWEPEATRTWDKKFDAKYRLTRHLVEDNGRVVATSRTNHAPQRFDPREFDIHIQVHPDAQGQGYGRALYDFLRGLLEPDKPTCIRSRCREDTPRAVRFLHDRGFVEENRDWESTLDLTRFDPAPYRDLLDRVVADGIAIKTLDEIRGEEGWERKLYDLTMHVQADMPMPVGFVAISFDDWHSFVVASSQTRDDTYLVAISGDRYIGLSILMNDPSDATNLNTDDTGVHRDFRRRGIATALKVMSLNRARELGFRTVRTLNESSNRPMLAINERLGFVKAPAWIWYIKNLDR